MNTNEAVSDHHTGGSRDISRRALLIMFPQLFMDGSTPMSTYDSTASANTRPLKSSTTVISTMCMTFGRMCRSRMRRSLAPSSCAASTNS